MINIFTYPIPLQQIIFFEYQRILIISTININIVNKFEDNLIFE